MHRSVLFATCLAALAACLGEEKDASVPDDTVDTDPVDTVDTEPEDTDTPPADTDTPPADSDTEPDTQTNETGDTGAVSPFLEVAAIGFELTGSWDQDQELIEPHLFPDLYGGYGYPIFIPTQVFVTLATLDYFSYAGAPPTSEYCLFTATFDGAPVALTAMEFDYTAGTGSTGVDLETWGMFEGKLTIDTMSAECSQLDPVVWPGGDPMALMDGMHFGVGYGPLSTYLEGQLSGDPAWPTVDQAYVSQYIAINHPDGAGGYEFVPYDWNAALLVDTDYSVCETYYLYGNPVAEEVCGQVELKKNMGAFEYVLGDQDIQPIHAVTLGFSMWLEDTPNLDLTLLKDGA